MLLVDLDPNGDLRVDLPVGDVGLSWVILFGFYTHPPMSPPTHFFFFFCDCAQKSFHGPLIVIRHSGN